MTCSRRSHFVEGDGSAIWNRGGPILEDISGDGRKDLVFAWYDSNLGLRVRSKISNGDGTYTGFEDILGDGDMIWNRSGPLAGDVDGDGRADLVFAYDTGRPGMRLRTKLSNGDGTYTPVEDHEGDGGGVWANMTPRIGDVNGDGRSDLIFAWHDSGDGLQIRSKISNGDGTYWSTTHRDGDGAAIWNEGAPLVGDVDADGDADLVFAWYDAQNGLRLRTKRSNGDGTFDGTEEFSLDGDAIWNSGQPLFADVDGSGGADIVFPFDGGAPGLTIRTQLSIHPDPLPPGCIWQGGQVICF